MCASPGSAKDAGATPDAAAGMGGVKIRITPPRGWTAKSCKNRSALNGSTNSAGKLKLQLCASRSGPYTVTSSGAVTTGPLMLRVHGAPPMVPMSLSGTSPRGGQARIAWAPPVYAGGATVTSYRLVASAAGQKARTIVFKVKPSSATHLRYTFTKLARYKVWTFSAAAVTKYSRRLTEAIGPSQANSCVMTAMTHEVAVLGLRQPR
jgi:hypothetical protein